MLAPYKTFELVEPEMIRTRDVSGHRIAAYMSFEEKIEHSKKLIDCWYEAWDGDIYISFSGGKDSTVLTHLVRSMFPDVPAIFADTGLEFPEIRAFVKTIENVKWVRPKIPFHKVIEKHGYPVVSKKVALMIHRLKNPSEKNENIRRLYLTGYNSKGEFKSIWKLPKKWHKLIDAPFKIHNICCDIIKKRPLIAYAQKTERFPMIGTMAAESGMRNREFLLKGCSYFDSKSPKLMPLSLWTEENIWQYIRTYNIPYSSIYDMGYDRTGCMFCCFGVHLEKSPNRFQLMRKTHPKIWNYCMNKLDLKEVLKFIGVNYK